MADIQAEEVRKGTAHEKLFAVAFDGTTGYAVGDHGLILRSTNGGTGWVEEQSPTPLALLGVAVAGDYALAVGQMGSVILRLPDGQWQLAESGTRERLLNVAINSSGQALAVGAFGTLLRSEDAGRSWTPAAPDYAGVFEDPEQRLGPFFTPSLYGVQLLEDGRAWVCGELQLILHSSDAGLGWKVLSAGSSTTRAVSPTLTAVVMSEQARGYAVGQGGTVLASREKGDMWELVSGPGKANLFGINATDSGVILVSALRDLQLSLDKGQSWQVVTSSGNSADWYQGVAILADVETAVAVGDQARILRLQLPKNAQTGTGPQPEVVRK